VAIRAGILGMTRLDFARRSGISRGVLRDLELGVHTPIRYTLQRFMDFCERLGVPADQLEELRRLYAGSGEPLSQFLARLELRAGSSRTLARRVGLSPTTLWEYRRGRFPLPWDVLVQLCHAAGTDPAAAEPLWLESERGRLYRRGYPEAWAELEVLAARAGYAESHLLKLGLKTATCRRLRYLELPPWEDVAAVGQAVCRNEAELAHLKRLWIRDTAEPARQTRDRFGPRLRKLREQKGIERRELADLFEIGGKKPARIIKYIEEDGFYSMQAYPAGLAALLADEPAERDRLLRWWRERREHFHRRRRPETRIDLRLAREQYGLDLQALAPILGYNPRDYQRIEAGIEPLLESAQVRILGAIYEAGHRRVEALLLRRDARDAQRVAWQAPPSVPTLIALLSRREGGLAPLARSLKEAGVKAISSPRLRALQAGRDIPPWGTIERIAVACGVSELTEVRRDWEIRFRAQLQARCRSPLGVELRFLIGEIAPSLRAFSPRLGLNYSVLVREFQRIDRDEPVKWFHIERIIRAVGLSPESDRWKEIRGLWSTVEVRRKKLQRQEFVFSPSRQSQ
jgi:transcriptional regulator with XRE-family HTH domain